MHATAPKASSQAEAAQSEAAEAKTIDASQLPWKIPLWADLSLLDIEFLLEIDALGDKDEQEDDSEVIPEDIVPFDAGTIVNGATAVEVSLPEPLEDVPPEAEAIAGAEAPEKAVDEVSPVVSEAGEEPGDAMGAPVSEFPDVELIMPEPKGKLGEDEELRLSGVQKRTKKVARRKADLPDAESHKVGALGQVKEPKEETLGFAESELLTGLINNAPASPEIVKLCEAIEKDILEQKPTSDGDLAKSVKKTQEIAKKAHKEMKQKIEEDANKVQKENKERVKTPDTGDPRHKTVDIVPPKERKSRDIDATKAVPDAVATEDVSLDADAASSQARIDSAGMTTEPAQLVQSGPIAGARQAQNDLQKLAKVKPAETLADQQKKLKMTHTSMADLQQKTILALSKSRRSTTTRMKGQQLKMVAHEEKRRKKDKGEEANTVFNEAQKSVRALLDDLPKTALNLWKDGDRKSKPRIPSVGEITRVLREDIGRVQDRIDEHHSGFIGFFRSGINFWTDLPGWAFKGYRKAEEKFGNAICALITAISKKVNGVIAACQEIINNARIRIIGIYRDVDDELDNTAKEQLAGFHRKLNGLENEVIETRDDFNQDLISRATQTVMDVRDQIHALREEAKGFLTKVGEFIDEFVDDPVKAIINGLLDLLSIPRPAFWRVVEKIKKVVSDIADDPLGFAGNLLAALAQGFDGFFERFPTYLLEGLLDWLFSGLRSMDIEPPKDFSLKSILLLFLQVMGITWESVRGLLAKHVGEENVALIENAFEKFSLLKEKGLDGIYEMIKDQLSPQVLVDRVKQAGVDFLVSAIMQQAAIRLVAMFNPVGAILQAVEAIYRVLKWVFVNAAKIFSLIEAIVNGLADLVAGNVDAMAKTVELALAGLISPVIDFLADFFRLGNMRDRLQETIKGFRGWVESILDRVIGWLAGQATRRLVAEAPAEEAAATEAAEGTRVAKGDTVLGTSVSFSANGETHRQWVKTVGSDAILMIASDKPEPVKDKLKRWSSTLDEQFQGDKKAKAEAARLIASARTLLGRADSLVLAFKRANKLRGEDTPEIPSDDSLESEQRALSTIMKRLYVLFNEEPQSLADRFVTEFAKMDDLAAKYSLSKLEEADQDIQNAVKWNLVRTWLLRNGMIFTQPLTQTTNFVKEKTQPQAEGAAQDAVKAVVDKNGLSAEDAKKVKLDNILKKSRSHVNSGKLPFEASKIILQEYGFDRRIRPHLTLKNAYLESSALANEMGLGKIQLHHLVTEQMVEALESYHPHIPGQALRDNPRYQYNASPGGHIGYEKWHRDYDSHMLNFIRLHPGMLNVDDLILEIHNYYQEDHGENVTKRIPGVNLL